MMLSILLQFQWQGTVMDLCDSMIHILILTWSDARLPKSRKVGQGRWYIDLFISWVGAVVQKLPENVKKAGVTKGPT